MWLLIGICAVVADATTSSRDEAFAEMALMQMADSSLLDRPKICVDCWKYNVEYIPDNLLPSEIEPPQEPLKYLEVLATRPGTSVLNILADPSVVIVYRQFCMDQTGIDNTVMDYWFLSYLEDTGVVPKVYTISQALSGDMLAGIYGAEARGKLGLGYCRHTLTRPTIRYVIMEKIYGKSIEETVHEKGSFSINVAASVGIQIVSILQRIHSLGVIHGDAHWGNFLIDHAKVHDPWMKMIDFEFATIHDRLRMQRIAEPICETGAEPTPDSQSPDSNATPWERVGCPKSFRDDMYHALLVIAAALYGDDYLTYFQYLSTGPDVNVASRARLLGFWDEHRFSGHIFNVEQYSELIPDSIRSRFLLVDVLPEGVLGSVASELDNITTHVLSLGLHDRPDYEGIIELLENIVDDTRDIYISLL